MKRNVKTRISPLSFDNVIFNIFQKDPLPEGAFPVYEISTGSTTYILTKDLGIRELVNKENDSNVLNAIPVSIDSNSCERSVIEMLDVAAKIVSTELEDAFHEMQSRGCSATRILCHPDSQDKIQRGCLQVLTSNNIGPNIAYLLGPEGDVGVACIYSDLERFGVGLFSTNAVGKIHLTLQ